VSSLLDHRLVIVTGKGGTGKTTVSACLALAAAQRGQRVLVAEVARSPQVARLLDPSAPEVGYAARRVAPGICVMRIDPFAALAEYIGLQIGFQHMAERVLRSRGFRQLMEASPGWRELITLGKVWHLEQMQENGRPLYDLIVVDAPATGHGVALLEVPRLVVSAVSAGPLRHHTERVEALIEDASRTLLLPVARAPRDRPARAPRARPALASRGPGRGECRSRTALSPGTRRPRRAPRALAAGRRLRIPARSRDAG
jgi:anion-transporting  ArsA/GET3 family ATPase